MKTSSTSESGAPSGAKEKIYQSLRADIISHRLRPGQAVREDELAERFGISRTPVREMLRRLEHEDLVKVIPNRGVFVSELTAKDIEEVLEIRMALESAAARSAAPKINEIHVAELKEIGKLMDEGVKRQDSIASFEADTRLHTLILTAAGNGRALRIISNLMGQIHRIRFISGHKPGRIDTTVNEHKRIVQALLERNPDKAEEAMKIHLLSTKEILLPSSDTTGNSKSSYAVPSPSDFKNLSGVWCQNNDGQLGDGTTTQRTSPVLASLPRA